MGPESKRRAPLTRAAVLAAAVALADRDGLDAVSMRNLAQELGVVPMALYKHVANKDELLDGMADAIVAEIDPPRADLGWKQALRGRIQSARDVMLRHRWASRVLATRTQPSPVVLAGLDAVIATLLAGGLSPGLIHQVMHTLAGPERPTLHRGDDDLVLDQVCLDVPGRLWEAEVAFWATMTGRTPRAIVRTRSSGTAATTTRSSRSALTSSWTGSSGCTGPRPRPHSPPAESDGTWGTEGSWGHGHSAPTGELVGHARPAPGSATHNYPLPPGAALR